MAQNARLYRLEVDTVGPTGNSGRVYRAELVSALPNNSLLYRVELTAQSRSLYQWNGSGWLPVVLYTYYQNSWVQTG